ncbi:acetoacetate-CoA ligase [Fonticula alba]|uniref:Acetoacetate-CoA ligase n=1 Tax=Fonticula alba TaxID=691883 RepID=A0A058ZG52_FONAL|nr:acetoacetate-CoA ligase [Fonticula alba]KCV72931.1 acetoacetate-CoA ligase [Fonticula alba]|eukprot:XP_009492632.1 acetoacetate-CoA ligase [Fonticula alba]
MTNPIAEAESIFGPTCPTPLWTPSAPEATNMFAFMQMVNNRHGLNLASYPELLEWSTDQIDLFWSAVWDFTNIISSTPAPSASGAMVVPKDAHPADVPVWFPEARLNYAENCLWPAHVDNGNSIAIYSASETRPLEKVTFAELHTRVQRCAAALRAAGVTVNDRVGGYIANCIEAVVAMLATISIGAIWSSTSPDFGTKGVLERFSQIKPKVIFTVNAVVYNGRTFSQKEKLEEIINNLPEVEHVVIVPFHPKEPVDLSIRSSITFDDFMSTGRNGPGEADFPPLVFEQLPFNHPGFILFSSGTTGNPKCIVHSTGGPLLQHKKEHMIHGDVSPKDVVFQYTTTGWMMWNWLVSTLSVGAAIVLFDGSPLRPSGYYLYQLAEELGVTCFGASAKYFAAIEEAGIQPNTKHDLSKIRSVYSTGSPLKPESFDFIYAYINKDLCLGSITGGTDIVSLFAGHNTMLPVYRGEIQCICLGMKVECWDEETAKSVPRGNKGDLVCTKPFPCAPVYFWNDSDGSKYRSAYFSNFENVWYHGDFMAISPHTGGILMLGRSDGTLNPGGIRIGTAELYNLIEPYEQIADCLVVGQPMHDDERVIMFLQMAEGHELDDNLINKIRLHIRSELSPRHVPSFILPVADIPHTTNGKKVEVAVKRILGGQDIVPSGAISNPDSLQIFYTFRNTTLKVE